MQDGQKRSPQDEAEIEKVRNLMRKVDSDPRIKAAVREALKKVGAWQEPETGPDPADPSQAPKRDGG